MAHRDSFTSFLICILLVSFSCLFTPAGISSTVLNRSENPCFVSNLRRGFQSLTNECEVSRGLSLDALYQVAEDPF